MKQIIKKQQASTSLQKSSSIPLRKTESGFELSVYRGELSQKELEVLAYLVQNRGFYVSLETLHQNVWEGKEISFSDIRMCIKRLREKTDKDFIKTKRYLGYKIDK